MIHMGWERLVEEATFMLIEECHEGARVWEELLGKRAVICGYSGMEKS